MTAQKRVWRNECGTDVRTVLSEYPWLWATRARWGESMRITVKRFAGVQDLLDAGFEAKYRLLHIYLHFSDDESGAESVHEVLRPNGASIPVTFRYVRSNTALNIRRVRHVAFHERGETVVLLSKGPALIGSMIDEHLGPSLVSG